MGRNTARKLLANSALVVATEPRSNVCFEQDNPGITAQAYAIPMALSSNYHRFFLSGAAYSNESWRAADQQQHTAHNQQSRTENRLRNRQEHTTIPIGIIEINMLMTCRVSCSSEPNKRGSQSILIQNPQCTHVATCTLTIVNADSPPVSQTMHLPMAK